MLKLTFLVVLVTTGLFQLATGSPAASIPTRRDSTEGVYLSNCNNGLPYSEMDYYANAVSGSQNGEIPDATALVSDGDTIWEGEEICGFFSISGDTFCSNIVSYGQSLNTGDFAGTGFNDETQFNCFKDNERILYSANGATCNSVYYCFDA